MRKLAFLLLLLLGCSGGPASGPAQPTPTPQTAQLTPDVEALVRSMPSEDEFAPADVDAEENLPLFVRLAATSNEDPLRIAALRALRDNYLAHAIDAYTQAVARNLASTNPKVLHAALEASSPALGREASPEVRDAIEQLTGSRDRAVRVAALDTFAQAEPFPSQVYLRALADSDPVIRGVAVLATVRQRVRDHAFFGPALKLLLDPDPGVRGKAVELAFLSAPGSEREQLAPRLEAMLGDPHPFVRSQALLGLAYLRRLEVVPRLMPLLSDRSSNSYELEFTNMLGEPDRLYFKSPRGARVDDTALGALSRLSNGRFPYQETRREEDIQRDVQRARQWYRYTFGLD